MLQGPCSAGKWRSGSMRGLVGPCPAWS
jgi:hypothetical protein